VEGQVREFLKDLYDLEVEEGGEEPEAPMLTACQLQSLHWSSLYEV